MPGWYIHMDVARKALTSLPSNPRAAGIFGAKGPTAAQLSQIAQNNPAYLALGAIGPDIFFLLPDYKPPGGTMLWGAANTIKEIYEWWDDHFLSPYEDQIEPVYDNLSDQLGALTGGLSQQISDIISGAYKFLLDKVLLMVVRQVDVFGLLGSGVPSGYDEQVFFWSDMLHYRRTYEFGARLWQEADKLNNDRLRAFALGWMTHLATDVTGHPFVNEKAGGPYRLHWQRHHLVENHMDALVYDSKNGNNSIYQMLSCSALHLWIAFNPDGSSRVNSFAAQPGPSYSDGDKTPDILDRKSKWDVDSGMPDDLANFLAQALRDQFNPQATGSPNLYSVNSQATVTTTGQWACCPTIITDLSDRIPDPANQTGATPRGYAEPGDIQTTYWWLYHYVKWTTTDYFDLLRPDDPSFVNIPPFPSPPGSGSSDPGPGGSDNSAWHDFLEILLAIFAWITYLGQVAAYPATVLLGLINSAGTYPIRQLLYENVELPLYNAWLALHWYLAMTGFVSPMRQEISPGLTTLGIGVADVWTAVQAALNDPKGGLNIPPPAGTEPSGDSAAHITPLGAVVDPASFVATAFNFGPSRTCIDPQSPGSSESPTEYTRPWLFPLTDGQGDPIFPEYQPSFASPYTAPQDATVLMAGAPGDLTARTTFESAKSEADTILAGSQLLPGKHLGDPVDYSAYVIANLTRTSTMPAANFNLDADRGYGYLCWDWVRSKDATETATPSAFAGKPDPRRYRAPIKAGYGWCNRELDPNASHIAMYDTTQGRQSVAIRYIDKEGKTA
jgi:hypothetical protein